jgi:hypothetical protein
LDTRETAAGPPALWKLFPNESTNLEIKHLKLLVFNSQFEKSMKNPAGKTNYPKISTILNSKTE